MFHGQSPTAAGGRWREGDCRKKHRVLRGDLSTKQEDNVFDRKCKRMRNKRRLTTRGAMFALALRASQITNRKQSNPVRVCFISRLSVSENISRLPTGKHITFARAKISLDVASQWCCTCGAVMRCFATWCFRSAKVMWHFVSVMFALRASYGQFCVAKLTIKMGIFAEQKSSLIWIEDSTSLTRSVTLFADRQHRLCVAQHHMVAPMAQS